MEYKGGIAQLSYVKQWNARFVHLYQIKFILMILITGGTGFIRNYVIQNLLQKNNNLVVVVRNIEKAKAFKWSNKVELMKWIFMKKLVKKFKNY